ncbi:MAG: pyridoxamine 5'-phosphate oxidase [Verrucomicrobia subdivision 3 bacterium]|nr:pyridoxamine 5'-phosphate oxidase [Limisphaerales bacterium]
MAIADLRREYQAGGLDQQDLATDPLAQFQDWFGHAAATQSGSRWRKIGIALFKLWQAILGHAPADVNAMVLATATGAGQPSARTVLLKGVDSRGFIFFTNYDSRKSQEISQNPNVALVFYWPELERQVCVAGPVTKLPVTESAAYFQSRPRGSQLGAWASNQSMVVASRQVLDQKWQEVAVQFPQQVPLPPNWGGFVLSPTRLEFWQGRASRLHDRFCYTKLIDGAWQIERLSP